MNTVATIMKKDQALITKIELLLSPSLDFSDKQLITLMTVKRCKFDEDVAYDFGMD